MSFINSILHSPTMGQPNKRAVRKLKCYESIHENTSFFFVFFFGFFCFFCCCCCFAHVIAHSYKNMVLFTCFFLKWICIKNKIKSTFKIYSKQLNYFLIQNLSMGNIYIFMGVLELVKRWHFPAFATKWFVENQ